MAVKKTKKKATKKAGAKKAGAKKAGAKKATAKKATAKKATAKKGKLPTKVYLFLCWRALKVALAVSRSKAASKAKKARAKKSLPEIQKEIDRVRTEKLKQKPIKWRR